VWGGGRFPHTKETRRIKSGGDLGLGKGEQSLRVAEGDTTLRPSNMTTKSEVPLSEKVKSQKEKAL